MKSKYFKIQELVSEDVYKNMEKSHGCSLMKN